MLIYTSAYEALFSIIWSLISAFNPEIFELADVLKSTHLSFWRLKAPSNIVSEFNAKYCGSAANLFWLLLAAMSTTYCFNHSLSAADSLVEDFSFLSAERDFMTPDGRLVPRALGEAALRQHTALLIGGLLVGFWPTQLWLIGVAR